MFSGRRARKPRRRTEAISRLLRIGGRIPTLPSIWRPAGSIGDATKSCPTAQSSSRTGSSAPRTPFTDWCIRALRYRKHRSASTGRAQDFRDAPPLSYCVETLDSLLRGSIPVAHCASIERRFNTRAFREHFHTFDCPVVDTAVLAKHVLGMPACDSGGVVSLEYAAMALQLPVFTPHHALGDVMATATLFLALANKLCDTHGETASPLLELGSVN